MRFFSLQTCSLLFRRLLQVRNPKRIYFVPGIAKSELSDFFFMASSEVVTEFCDGSFGLCWGGSLLKTSCPVFVPVTLD